MNSTPPLVVPKKSRFWKILLLLLALALGWSLYVASSIVAYAQVDETTQADVAIVLGAGVRNGQPSGIFRERINHAIDLYERGVVDSIIFTGGVGPGNQLAGSEVARQYAVEHGVPPASIFIETNSTDTRENLDEALSVMGAQGFTTALIVSDPLHMYRAMAIANDLGMDAYPSPTPTSRIDSIRAIVNFMTREIVSVTVYLLFPSS
ncbi:MAG: YdcF family protein [Chloroflexi bacterium]|nr:YdcF family protein [Chloroflexota bacterium]